MLTLLTAELENAVNQLFDDIQAIEESATDWIIFYRQKWIIESLNKCMSKIANEVWITSPNNTNVTEAAHALCNCRGRDLKLLTAILH
ncbi:8643_t:CDS:2 [Funneliformis caledonium]|uniref:8643_t:CDS:1 n=1 Tax=Funneliformis caledonium TaxID=1117310 RepID=A0A9N9FXW3_9GLOM|nr:8643_t:CDS:2 [Funneliformis caledonium]